jgi:hypothetical protein
MMILAYWRRMLNVLANVEDEGPFMRKPTGLL